MNTVTVVGYGALLDEEWTRDCCAGRTVAARRGWLVGWRRHFSVLGEPEAGGHRPLYCGVSRVVGSLMPVRLLSVDAPTLARLDEEECGYDRFDVAEDVHGLDDRCEPAWIYVPRKNAVDLGSGSFVERSYYATIRRGAAALLPQGLTWFDATSDPPGRVADRSPFLDP